MMCLLTLYSPRGKFKSPAVFGIALVIIACFGGACQPRATATSAAETRYFAETGQTVQGEFRRAFERFGGVAGLGLPLTGEMRLDGWRVQYFERGRLEYHPENEAAYRVTVGWLGDLLQRRQPPLPPGSWPRTEAVRYFPQTGHTLTGDFRRFYEANGDSVRFGRPISEPFLVEGRLAQDFQSARFFWTPQQIPPITLEDTGRVHLQHLGLRP